MWLCMIVVMVGFLAGCTAEIPTYEHLKITDSAGVRIVVADGVLDERGFPAIQLPDKVDTIGAGLEEDVYQFTHIRGVVLTGNGVLVADQLSREIRYFDRQGSFLASLGGEGEGPGEFEELTWMRRREDGILVAWDGKASRLTSIIIGDSTLSFLSSHPLNVIPWKAQAMGVVGVDRLLLVGPGPDSPAPVLGRVNSGELVVGVASEEILPEMHRLATVPSRPAYFSKDSRIVQVPFTVLPDYVVGSEFVWLGNGWNGEIRKVHLDGTVRTILRFPPRGPVTDDDVAKFMESDIESHPARERSQRRRLLNQVPMPKNLPAFDRLILDDGERLWVGGYSSGSSSFAPWHIFDSDGCPIARVVIPARFRVLAIGHGRIAVSARDRLGVERVLLYALAEEPGAEVLRRPQLEACNQMYSRKRKTQVDSSTSRHEEQEAPLVTRPSSESRNDSARRPVPHSMHIEDRIYCPYCKIMSHSVTSLGKDLPDSISVGYPHGVYRSSEGHYFLAMQGNLRAVRVFDEAGKYVSSIRRPKRGPGHFSFIRWIAGNKDTLHVFDQSLATRTAFALPDTVPFRSDSVYGRLYHALALPGGGYVINAVALQRTLVGLPLHVYSAGGARVESFGSTSGGAYRADLEILQHRTFALSGHESFWVAQGTRYVVQQWNTDGTLLATFQRNAPWFPHHSHEGWYRHDTPMKPMIRGVSIDEARRMWVLIQVPDPAWRRAFFADSTDPSGYRYSDDPTQYFDTIVEVLDLTRKQVVVRQRFDQQIVAFVDEDEWLFLDNVGGVTELTVARRWIVDG